MDSDDARQTLVQIGRNIRAERARVGLRQEEVAHLAHMGVAQLARMERGEVDAGITKYVRVGRALGVDLAAILHGVQ
jgi:transcriptional regulator with XRE-family HTH domain